MVAYLYSEHKALFPLLETDVPLSPHTTFGVGGIGRYFLPVRSKEEFIDAVAQARRHGIRHHIVAGGSNIVFADGHLDDLIIKISYGSIVQDGLHVCADAGASLADLIAYTCQAGLGGLEKLSGIPGTVGGAIVGNAGAYGQTISDTLVAVEIFDGTEVRTVSRDECLFRYRDSVFKSQPWIALSARFACDSAGSGALKEKSREIVALREKKYPPGLRCPGSFFKNVLVENIPESARALIPADRDFYGKVPAWFFLNEVGARGMRQGGIHIALIHGNLLVNDGGATYEDVRVLADLLKKKVYERFGVALEEEVRYIT